LRNLITNRLEDFLNDNPAVERNKLEAQNQDFATALKNAVGFTEISSVCQRIANDINHKQTRFQQQQQADNNLTNAVNQAHNDVNNDINKANLAQVRQAISRLIPFERAVDGTPNKIAWNNNSGAQQLLVDLRVRERQIITSPPPPQNWDTARQQAIQEIKDHWDKQNFPSSVSKESVLGSDWEKEFTNKNSQGEINSYQEELKRKIDAAANFEKVRQELQNVYQQAQVVNKEGSSLSEIEQAISQLNKFAQATANTPHWQAWNNHPVAQSLLTQLLSRKAQIGLQSLFQQVQNALNSPSETNLRQLQELNTNLNEYASDSDQDKKAAWQSQEQENKKTLDKFNSNIQVVKELTNKVDEALKIKVVSQDLLDFLQKHQNDNSFAYQVVNQEGKKVDGAIIHLEGLTTSQTQNPPSQEKEWMPWVVTGGIVVGSAVIGLVVW
jgi:hypothetical protein